MSSSSGEPAFDRPEQLEPASRGLMRNEKIIAGYGATGTGTGVGSAHRSADRHRRATGSSRSGKKAAITSIPYSRVASFPFVSDKPIMGSFFGSGASASHLGAQTDEVSFRSDHKSRHAHSLPLHCTGRRRLTDSQLAPGG